MVLVMSSLLFGKENILDMSQTDGICLFTYRGLRSYTWAKSLWNGWMVILDQSVCSILVRMCEPIRMWSNDIIDRLSTAFNKLVFLCLLGPIVFKSLNLVENMGRIILSILLCLKYTNNTISWCIDSFNTQTLHESLSQPWYLRKVSEPVTAKLGVLGVFWYRFMQSHKGSSLLIWSKACNF